MFGSGVKYLWLSETHVLLEELRKYKNLSVAKVALTAFCWHFWYISEILVGLSLFDGRVEVDVKLQN